MVTGKLSTLFLCLLPCIFLQPACTKPAAADGAPVPPPAPPAAAFKLDYGTSVVYPRNGPADYIVQPVQPKAGFYTAFPEGLSIDAATGAVNVSKSETGLQYTVVYTAQNGDSSSTPLLLSGVSYPDRYFNLAAGDSIVAPIYNGDPKALLPATGNVFEEGRKVSRSGLSINPANGRINLLQTVRNGFFGREPAKDEKNEIEIVYRLNDNSQGAQNSIKVKLYYYNTISEVPEYLQEILQERDGLFGNINSNGAAALSPLRARGLKPRPPCVVIIAH